MTATGAEARPRLLLHTGTPKTGTTSLQVFLNANAQALHSRGLVYPEVELQSEEVPKHQWIVSTLIDGDFAKFRRNMRKVYESLSDVDRTVILSTEGIFNHWQDFSAEARQELNNIQQLFQVTTWTWYRDPADLYRSFYVQHIKNPYDETFLYGLDISPMQLLGRERIARSMDYSYFRDSVISLFGEDAVFSFAYSSDLISDVQKLLDLPDPDEAIDDRNITELTKIGVDLMRVVNRYDFHNAAGRRAAAYKAIVDICRNLGDVSPRFALSEEEREAARRCSPVAFSEFEEICRKDAERWSRHFSVRS